MTQTPSDEVNFPDATLRELGDVIEISNTDFEIIYVNPAFEQVTGYSRAEAVGHTPADLLRPADADSAVYQEIEAAVTRGLVWRGELRSCRKNGSIWTSEATITPVHDAQGEITQYVAIKRDITERKEAEEALLNRETYFRFLIENSLDIITLLDENRTITYESPSIQRLLGYSQEELVGRNVYELIHPDDASHTKRAFQKAVADSNHIAKVTLRFRHKDGSWRFLEATGRSRMDDPTVRAVIVNSRDVTEREQTEDALRASEARLANAQRIAHLGNWVRDYATDALIWSDEVFRIFGHPPRLFEPYLKDFFSVIHPSDLEKDRAALRKAVQTHSPYTIDHRIVRPDGEIRWVHQEGEVEYDDADQPRRTFGTIQDITERKLAEEALRGSEARLRGILETAGEGIISVDRLQTITLFNPGAEKIFGYAADEVIGKPLGRLLPERYRGAHKNNFDRFADSDVTNRVMGERIEVAGLRKDGTEFPAQASISKFQATGEPLYTVHVVDISDRRAVEKQLQAAQRLETVGKLAGGVAHEFNNLLTVVTGNLEFAEETLGDREEIRLIERARNAALRGAQLTGQLLSYSRRHPLQSATVSVAEVIDRAVTMFRPAMSGIVEVDLNLAPNLWDIHVDQGRLEDALLNLAINSRDAMPGGGVIRIEAENIHIGKPLEQVDESLGPGDYVTIRITDGGAGMSPEVLAQAFDPFFTTKDVGQGTGLGLSMVYGFAKQSGGDVQIESKVGHGTSVTLYLPRSETTDGTQASESPREIPVGVGSIVIVEDDQDVRVLTEKIVRSLGYQAVVAQDPDSAIAMLQSDQPIDLLLTDIMLPGGTNGLQLAETAQKIQPDLKVLFVTGYDKAAIEAEGTFERRNTRVLRKPCGRADLANALHDLLTRPEQPGETGGDLA